MSNYTRIYSDAFKGDIAGYGSNTDTGRRLRKKIGEIMDAPDRGKPLRNVLKGKRSYHVGHKYVLIYEINKKDSQVLFHRFIHRDISYK